jgi:ABC-2 type transport system ATP-binding protein
LISSHILTELEGFCTSIGIMERGSLVRSGKIEDVTAADSSARAVDLRWIGPSGASIKQVLAQFAEVSAVELQSGEGHFNFTGSDERLSDLVAALVSAQVRLTSFNEVKATVEDLYMRLSHHEVM